MKSSMKFIPALIFVVLSICAQAQSDSTLKSKIIARPVKTKKATSQTGLELIYKSHTSTSYNPTTHSFSTSTVTRPYIRLNGGNTVAIDKRGDVVRRYLYKCPLALEQINQFSQENKQARRYLWGGFGVAGVFTFGGLVLSTKVPESKSTATFFTSFGLGVGAMVAGGIVSMVHHRRADKHLHSSISLYNQHCYIAPKKDSTLSSSPLANGKIKTPPQKMNTDTLIYDVVRNEPECSNLYGVSIQPVILDVYRPSMSIAGGIGLFYTYKSAVGVSLNFQTTYLEHADGLHESDKPTYESYGVPARDRVSKQLELQTKFTLASWKKITKYPMHVSYTEMGEMSGRVPGTTLKAISGRLGFIHDLRKIEGEGNLPLVTTQAPYVLHMDDGTDQELPRTGLDESTVLLQSEIITAGVAWSTYRDMKIQLKDKQYRGRRELKTQADLFIDVMYAPSMKYEDLLYSYPVYQSNGTNELLKVTSPFSRTGARIGYQSMGMGRFFGTKYIMELGLRPGPALSSYANAYFKMTYSLIFGGRQK
ncbi:hypothetical protein [Chitinophaga sp.]|uniref:hypothetical protein n=1 Tax=Chitinophaga sp. TaxID=1869181 RepID=UPI002F91C9FA